MPHPHPTHAGPQTNGTLASLWCTFCLERCFVPVSSKWEYDLTDIKYSDRGNYGYCHSDHLVKRSCLAANFILFILQLQ